MNDRDWNHWLRAPMLELQAAADTLNHEINGPTVTYVVNRNLNFTNICTVGCSFCGFQRRASDPDAHFHSVETMVARLATTPWVDEVCIQSGIHPGAGPEYYFRLLRALKASHPRVHIHAFSPMEIFAMRRSSGLSYEHLLSSLRDCGLGSIPGTAAEILCDDVRTVISGNKLPAAEWETIIRCAHRCGLPSSSTLLYGHIETWHHIHHHLQLLRRIQEETGGFTEFVPLAFVPYQNRLGRRLSATRPEVESLQRARRLYPLARLFFATTLPNLQTSWVKLGAEGAAQMLHLGCNDFGGTLYEESITRSSGGRHGEGMEAEQIEAVIRAAGRIPARRNTLYGRMADRHARAPGHSMTSSCEGQAAGQAHF